MKAQMLGQERTWNQGRTWSDKTKAEGHLGPQKAEGTPLFVEQGVLDLSLARPCCSRLPSAPEPGTTPCLHEPGLDSLQGPLESPQDGLLGFCPHCPLRSLSEMLCHGQDTESSPVNLLTNHRV